MKVVIALLLCLLLRCTSETVVHANSTAECKITVVKDKIASRGIASKVSVTVERNWNNGKAVVNISSGGLTLPMDPMRGSISEFGAKVTPYTLGWSHYEICVSECSRCEQLNIYSIPAPLTLLPPIVTVLLAVISRQVLLSLSCGVFVAAFLSSAYNPIDAFITTLNTYIILPFLDPSKAGVIILSCLMGGLIEVMDKSGGAKGFTDKLFIFASTAFHASALTVCVSLAFFFDDFASIMIAGKSLKSLVSVLGLSKQKFSLIVHSMAVIVASLCPLSSWAGIQIGYIESAFKLVNMEVSGFRYLIHSIPYRFFVLSSLFSVVLYVLIDRDIVPMINYEEEQLKRREEEPISDITNSSSDEGVEEDEVKTEKDSKERWFNAIIPLLVLVGITLLRMYYDGKAAIEESGDNIPLTFLNCVSRCNSINCLIIGTSVSLLLTIILIPAQRIMGLYQCMEHFVEGVKSMTEPNMVIILAWSLGVAMNDIHTSEYIALALEESMPVQYFPTLVCLIGYCMSYASGSALGTQGIIFPLVVPVIVYLTEDEVIYTKTIAAALSSTVFGNLCSPIADTTIAGVLFTGCPMLDHIKVMSTFCVPLAVITLIFGDLLVGLSVYPFYVSYFVTSLVVLIVFGVFGRQPGKVSVFHYLWRKVSGKELTFKNESSDFNERTTLISEKVV